MDDRFFRLYSKNKEECPEILDLTEAEEFELDSDNFVTKFRYKTIAQAEEALVLYLRWYFAKKRSD